MSSIPTLTSRQKAVLSAICDGWSNKQIAELLELSVKTVEARVSELYILLDVKSGIRFDLIWQADVSGLIPNALGTQFYTSKILSPTENELMRRLSTGVRASEVCVALGMKKRTLDYHLANILKKLKVDSTLQAILLMRGKGLGTGRNINSAST